MVTCTFSRLLAQVARLLACFGSRLSFNGIGENNVCELPRLFTMTYGQSIIAGMCASNLATQCTSCRLCGVPEGPSPSPIN